MKEQVLELFHIIDNHRWEELYIIFHPSVIYERPGYQTIKGIEELVYFYKEKRIISTGKHIFLSIVQEKDHLACWGRFVGVDKENSTIDIEFTDIYYFTDNLIHFRKTFFYTPLI